MHCSNLLFFKLLVWILEAFWILILGLLGFISAPYSEVKISYVLGQVAGFCTNLTSSSSGVVPHLRSFGHGSQKPPALAINNSNRLWRVSLKEEKLNGFCQDHFRSFKAMIFGGSCQMGQGNIQLWYHHMSCQWVLHNLRFLEVKFMIPLNCTVMCQVICSISFRKTVLQGLIL